VAAEEQPEKPPLSPEAFNTAALKRALHKAILRKHTYPRYPEFWEALKEDVRTFSAVRGEPRQLDSRRAVLKGALELAMDTDAFIGLALYRMRTALLARDVPVLPQLLHRVCMACFQINIGEPVVIEPGIYIPHGQIVLDGQVEIGRYVTLSPWVTIGLAAGNVEGPKVGNGVMVGTGAKLIGDITVGSGARIGANAVVVKNVPPNTTVVGVPARPVAGEQDAIRIAVAAKRKAEREKRAAQQVDDTTKKV
jgi:serine O-acetyltransferase